METSTDDRCFSSSKITDGLVNIRFSWSYRNFTIPRLKDYTLSIDQYVSASCRRPVPLARLARPSPFVTALPLKAEGSQFESLAYFLRVFVVFFFLFVRNSFIIFFFFVSFFSSRDMLVTKMLYQIFKFSGLDSGPY